MESQVLDIVEQVLEHMYTMTEYEHHSSIMLAGDPGIGKTTFVKTLAELLGMQLTTIEVPHISEEHLINIPFILFDPINKKEVKDKIQFEPTSNSEENKSTGYKLVLAHSNLYTLINKAQKVPDAKYLNHLYHVANPHVKELYEALGGTETKIPEDIQHARTNHNMILFLDEYWRQTSMRIRNVLREMLNNNIGTHQIPEDVYLIYASNMRDSGGLEPQPPNAEFKTVEFKPPTKDEWFNWLKSEFKDKGHKHLDLKPEVLDAFEKGMEDADISTTDPDSQVRTSPRRWAQLIMYVNTSFPPTTEQDAISLLHNVKNYFINYSTEEYSEKLRDKISKIVAKLIKDHSNFKNISHTAKNDDADWRTSFDHYIEQYMRASGARKHVPVISGPPGIGKTMFAAQSAAKHGLRLIEVPAASLGAEDIIGMPLPGDKKGQDISVKFSVPKLHKLIADKIEKADRDYIESLKGDKDKITAYTNQRWKYLIFFDEINTVGDEKTFNALRRVLLEKNFGPSDEKDSDGKHIDLKLPKEAIVFAALNPEGSHTRPITDHFKDVIDIIPAKASWDHTKKWLQSKNFESKGGKKIDVNIKDVSMNIVQELVDRFKTKDSSVPENRRPFTFEIDSAQLQMSPRALSDMYIGLVHTMDINVKKALDKLDSDDSLTPEQVRKDLDKKIARSLESSLNNSFYREGSINERDDFADRLPEWVQNLPDSTFNGILNKKIATSQPLSTTLDSYFGGKKDPVNMAEDEHITNNNTTLTDSEVVEEIIGIFQRHIKTADDVKKYMFENNMKKIEVNGDGSGIIHGTDETCKIVNFTLALLFTLHLYNFNNSRLNIIARGMSQGINKIRMALENEGTIDDDLNDEINGFTVDFRTDLADLVRELNTKG